MEFSKLIEERRSCRIYQADCTISKDQINELVKSTLFAPSWKNTETGRYYVATAPDMIEKIREAFTEWNFKNTKNVAALVVTTYVKNIAGHTAGEPDNELGNQWGAYDLGLQNAFLILKAKEMGYDSLIMGIRDSKIICKVLNIPETETMVSVIALGKREGQSILPPRKSVEEVCKIY